jgi:hypothetical protein
LAPNGIVKSSRSLLFRTEKPAACRRLSAIEHRLDPSRHELR